MPKPRAIRQTAAPALKPLWALVAEHPTSGELGYAQANLTIHETRVAYLLVTDNLERDGENFREGGQHIAQQSNAVVHLVQLLPKREILETFRPSPVAVPSRLLVVPGAQALFLVRGA